MSKQPVFSVAIVSQCFSGLHGKSTSVKDGGGKGKKSSGNQSRNSCETQMKTRLVRMVY